LGLVSQQLHNGGNLVTNYATPGFKHVLGLLLFTVILTFLICIGHFFGHPLLIAFLAFAAAVFWGTGS
jgi:hypothetical protein